MIFWLLLKIYLYDLFRGVPITFYLIKSRVLNVDLVQNWLDFCLGLVICYLEEKHNSPCCTYALPQVWLVCERRSPGFLPLVTSCCNWAGVSLILPPKTTGAHAFPPGLIRRSSLSFSPFPHKAAGTPCVVMDTFCFFPKHRKMRREGLKHARWWGTVLLWPRTNVTIPGGAGLPCPRRVEYERIIRRLSGKGGDKKAEASGESVASGWPRSTHQSSHTASALCGRKELSCKSEAEVN